MALASRLVGALLLLSSFGCASRPLGASFPLSPERVGATLARARAGASRGARAEVVVGVAEAPTGIFAYDLEARRLLFRASSRPTAVPALAGELVVEPRAGEIVLRRLRDGSVVRSIATEGMELVGADGDGQLAAIVLSTGGAFDVRSRLLLLSDESLGADLRVARVLGRPAVLGGVAFVPHQRVHLSAIDARGRELARMRIRKDVASYAFTEGGEVYFGQRGVYAVDPALARGEAAEPPYLPLAVSTSLPGSPPPLPELERQRPPPESALHRVSLGFLPRRTGGELALSGDALYYAFYRLVFSLTPDAARAHWVHVAPSDVVGMRAVEDGLIVVEQRGTVVALDAEGAVVYEAELGLRPLAARIEAQSIGARGASAPAAAAALAEAARLPDARLVPAQVLAAKLLGAEEDDAAAAALVELCTGSERARRVAEAACGALARRKLPSEAVLAALARHSDHLDEAPPPPLVELARAVRSAGDARATPLLLDHLADPATPEDALVTVLETLGALGDRLAAAPIGGFVRLYHAEPASTGLDDALVAGMEALARLDEQQARPLLDAVAHDALARAQIRGSARDVLAGLPEPVEPEATEAARPEEGATESVPAEPPAHLTSEHVEAALAAVRPELARCVREAPERPASARLVMVIEGDGAVQEVRSLPESVAACATPLVRSVRFPATKHGRRAVMTYVVAP